MAWGRGGTRRRLSPSSPLLEVATLFGVSHDPGVAVTVGHEEIARGAGPATSVGWLNWYGPIPGLPGIPKRQQELAVRGEPAHEVVADVGDPDVIVVIDSEAVGLLHKTRRPRIGGVPRSDRKR